MASIGPGRCAPHESSPRPVSAAATLPWCPSPVLGKYHCGSHALLLPVRRIEQRKGRSRPALETGPGIMALGAEGDVPDDLERYDRLWFRRCLSRCVKGTKDMPFTICTEMRGVVTPQRQKYLSIFRRTDWMVLTIATWLVPSNRAIFRIDSPLTICSTKRRRCVSVSVSPSSSSRMA